MAQRIDSHRHLRAATAFGPVLARTGAAFGRRLEGAAIEDGRRRFGFAPLREPQHRAQSLDNGVKHAGLAPALALLVHRRPGWQVMRHQAPRHPRSDYPGQTMKHLAPAVRPLGRLFGHQGQVWGYQSPFLITDITRICFARHSAGLTERWRVCHTANVASSP
jgi:hypothetical protein